MMKMSSLRIFPTCSVGSTLLTKGTKTLPNHGHRCSDGTSSGIAQRRVSSFCLSNSDAISPCQNNRVQKNINWYQSEDVADLAFAIAELEVFVVCYLKSEPKELSTIKVSLSKVSQNIS